MSDAAGFGELLKTARLLREIDEGECLRRNALSEKRKGVALRQGSVVTVLETLDEGKAFLVEFGQRAPDTCDWLGVLYPSEIEMNEVANGR
ncbi:MAG TPA: hypothetical protein VG966_05655 [Hyphomicrobiaceae bacterium]|jgi:hypothetical protein|nr:hypothetical protein [Hyphomicrobiaceae bacterium]